MLRPAWVRIVVPKLSVDAPVLPMGVNDAGLMEIPQDVSQVGWYEYGPVPGSSGGSSVLTGHVDEATQGPGVFMQLGDLEPGDEFSIVDDVGTSRTFSVIAREEWPKPEVPLGRIFDRGGESRVVLITCGGSFDPDVLGYDDNIAVTAVEKQ